MAKRTVMTVLREIATIKSQVSDESIRAALIAPLEAELASFAASATEQVKQLPLLPTPVAKSK